MKKIILSAAMLLAIGFTAKAQDIKYGIKAGLNLATLTGDVPSDISSRTSFHAGAVVEFKVGKNFSVQPELLYSEQGAEYNTIEEGMLVNAKFKFSYINLPVLAKYYVIEGLSIEAGPQIGFRTGAKVEVEVPGAGSAEVDFKDATESIDFAIVGGLAYDLPVGVFFQARYNAGLTKVNNDNIDKTKNGVFQFSVGYKF